MEIKIGNKFIGDNHPIFFIAEIGINHNGSLEMAKKLIDMACLCGADAVKFQKRDPFISVPKSEWDKMRDTPWGRMSYIEYKNKIELDFWVYEAIDEYCKRKKIIWFASPCDIPSVGFLEVFNIPAYKIASGKLTDRKMLECISKLGKPIILSTGMSWLYQIVRAMEILKNNEVIILHCNSAYPSKDRDLNIRGIHELMVNFKNIVGYSGHELGIAASFMAAIYGAKVIERHITLDRSMWGTDQSASLEYPGLRRLIRNLKKIPIWRGDGVIKVTDDEVKLIPKLRDTDTL